VPLSEYLVLPQQRTIWRAVFSTAPTEDYLEEDFFFGRCSGVLEM